MYSSNISLTSALDVAIGQRHVSSALIPEKTRYQMYWSLVGPQRRYGRLRKSRLHWDWIPGLSRP